MPNKTLYLSSNNLTSVLNKIKEKNGTKIYQSANNTKSSFYYTSKTLLQCINRLVHRGNGRISISKVGLEFSVDKKDILDLLTERSDLNDWDVVTTKSKDEVIIDSKLYYPILHAYIVDIVEEAYYKSMCNNDSSSSGIVSLSDLVLQLDLTPEIIESCISNSTTLLLLNKSNITSMTIKREEVTTKQIYEYRALEIQGVLLGISQPTSLDSLVDEYKWDSVDVIIEYLDKCDNIPGGLYHSNEVYIPHVYLYTQRKVVDDFFSSNGYISEKYCSTLGYDHLWTTPKLIDYMKESFVSVSCLKFSFFNCLYALTFLKKS